jgi:hypothetical protein
MLAHPEASPGIAFSTTTSLQLLQNMLKQKEAKIGKQ